MDFVPNDLSVVVVDPQYGLWDIADCEHIPDITKVWREKPPRLQNFRIRPHGRSQGVYQGGSVDNMAFADRIGKVPKMLIQGTRVPRIIHAFVEKRFHLQFLCFRYRGVRLGPLGFQLVGGGEQLVRGRVAAVVDGHVYGRQSKEDDRERYAPKPGYEVHDLEPR